MANRCKYYKEEEYISLDGGISWTAMGVYRKGDLIESGSTDCGYVPPVFDGKFKATYSGGQTYSAACDGNTELTSATTKPSGYEYSAMTEAIIGDCVTSIGQYAFSNCSGLKSITIPSGVTYIGGLAFSNCSGLTSITVEATTPPTFGRFTPFGGTNDCPIYVPCESVEAYKTAWRVYESRIQCVNPPTPEYRWTNSGWTCSGASGYDKYNLQVKEVSYDSGSTWSAVTPTETQLGTLIEANSENCGYIPPSTTVITYTASEKLNVDLGKFNPAATAETFSNGVGNIEFNSDVITIYSSAFNNKSGMTTIEIPNTVQNIQGESFRNCSGLSRFNSTIDGVFNIPSGVTSIGNWAFLSCKAMTAITIPSSSNILSSGGVFESCSNLSRLNSNIDGMAIIPYGITSIGWQAFWHCNLGNVIIPDSVTSIGYNAFYRCSGLTSCTIGSGVTSIGNNAFAACRNLTSCTIGSSVANIEYSAFEYCSGLTSITCLATTPPSLGADVFRQTNGYFAIYVPCESVDAYKSASGWSAYADRILCVPPQPITSITYTASEKLNVDLKKFFPVATAHTFADGVGQFEFASGVTRIGKDTFYYCTSLTSIDIPDSVTSIGESAFQNCSSLTSITCEATTPPTLGSGALYATNNCPIYVPSGSVNAYKTASRWSYYASRIQALP